MRNLANICPLPGLHAWNASSIRAWRLSLPEARQPPCPSAPKNQSLNDMEEVSHSLQGWGLAKQRQVEAPCPGARKKSVKSFREEQGKSSTDAEDL